MRAYTRFIRSDDAGFSLLPTNARARTNPPPCSLLRPRALSSPCPRPDPSVCRRNVPVEFDRNSSSSSCYNRFLSPLFRENKIHDRVVRSFSLTYSCTILNIITRAVVFNSSAEPRGRQSGLHINRVYKKHIHIRLGGKSAVTTTVHRRGIIIYIYITNIET